MVPVKHVWGSHYYLASMLARQQQWEAALPWIEAAEAGFATTPIPSPKTAELAQQIRAALAEACP